MCNSNTEQAIAAKPHDRLCQLKSCKCGNILKTMQYNDH